MPRLSDRLTVPIAPAHRAELKLAADAADTTVVAFVRDAALAKARRVRRDAIRERTIPRRAILPPSDRPAGFLESTVTPASDLCRKEPASVADAKRSHKG